jgi:chemotaxis protein MotB
LAKKQKHEEHENHERWLVSYADFITLLFAFFVVLYSISRVDNKRMAQVQQSIKFALHFKGTGGIDQLPLFEGPPVDGGKCRKERGFDEHPKTKQREAAEKARKRMEKKLKTYLQMRPQPQVVQIETERDRITVRLSASHFFDPSQAAIRPEMIPILDLIAEELATMEMPLRIEGHTDESRFGVGRFRDNWELSASRAAAVASYIELAHHMSGKLLSAAGFGSTRPLVQGNTAAAHEANRRVEMVVQFEPGGE